MSLIITPVVTKSDIVKENAFPEGGKRSAVYSMEIMTRKLAVFTAACNRFVVEITLLLVAQNALHDLVQSSRSIK